ncbi:MAG: hypothetical protein A3B23_00355 [Candidatus Colwellbacteria bacterium RIFCSPLOWO2_01_FULL_48_10]|uniref:Baseplate protein J-like domain-containing protein n=1 Tax=Candidatus Colwellbacteria bacterium RIFCSPLOWO2_01_FULL_48_10 TaxID=1797690 RepID=A0A1G1Z878_9BACT|nr:MAG: hypothetical protein A3B23_00355 [Candidatus Colwellbacteria bacterium RIFCSPLOWO2_01_FULL_48_10]
MTKIYVDKNDTAASIVEKIIDAGDATLLLYVPRFTKLASSVNNFRLLKREIDASGKSVEIESVDDDVLEMSKTVGIKSGNPFFKKNRRAVSDIVMVSEPAPRINVVHRRHNEPAHVHSEPEAETDEAPEIAQPVRERRHRKSFASPQINLPKFSVKSALSGIVVVGILVGTAVAATVILPKADIGITMDKINWDFNGSLYASTSVKDAVFSSGQARVPGVLLEKNKNMTAGYPATGSESVQRKAAGTITIYNGYSSDPQPLVKDTRFSSPDGKIFRITKALTIPGAKIIDNKIVPSAVEADVIADKAGAEYNIAPASFKVPGFQGTPKYDGFYGESKGAMTGGLIGVIKVATATDMANAKTAITKSVDNALRSEIALIVPQDIKILDGATRFTVTKIDTDKNADEAGNFKLTAYANIKMIGFRENDALLALEARLAEDVRLDLIRKGSLTASEAGNIIDLTLKEGYAFTYGAPKIDFDKKDMSISLKLHSVWTRAIDLEKFKAAIGGKKQKELASGPLPSPGIKSMNIKLWPFWVRTIPSNPAKISLDVR